MKKIVIFSLSAILSSQLMAADEKELGTNSINSPETSSGMDVKVNIQNDETKDFFKLLKELNEDALNKKQDVQNLQNMNMPGMNQPIPNFEMKVNEDKEEDTEISVKPYYNDIPKPYKFVKIGNEYVVFAKLTYRYKVEKKKEEIQDPNKLGSDENGPVSTQKVPRNFADSGLPNPNSLPPKPQVDVNYQPQYNQPGMNNPGMGTGMPGMNMGYGMEVNPNIDMMNNSNEAEDTEYKTKTVNIRMKLGDEFNGWVVNKINSQYVEFKFNDKSENINNLFGLTSLINKIENNKEDKNTKKEPILVRHYFEVK